MEHLHSILHAGGLSSSDDVTLGHRFDPNAPGVYCAIDAHVATALGYAAASHVGRDGTWWRCLFELCVHCIRVRIAVLLLRLELPRITTDKV